MGDRAAHAWRHDPSLPSPTTPPRAARPLPFDLGSSLPDATSHAAFVVRGRDAMVAGQLDEPAFDVRCNGARVVAALTVVGAAIRATRVTTLGAVRSLRVGGHDVVERVFVPAAGSAAVVEWSDAGREDAAPAAELVLEWSVPAPVGPAAPARRAEQPRWNASDCVLIAEGADAVVVVASADAVTVEARSGEDGSLRCTARLASSAGPIRLFVAAAGTGIPHAIASLERAYEADALTRARAARVRRGLRERAAARTGDDRLDRAFEWVGIRLAEDAERLTAPEPGDDATALRVAVVALGSMAAGDAAACERLVADWAAAPRLTPRAAALFLLLTGWHGRWTGDAAAFATQLTGVRRAVEALARHTHDPLGAAGLAEIARAAETAGPAFAAEARGVMASLASGAGDSAAASGLATLGTTAQPGRAAAAAEPDPWPALLDAVEALPGEVPAATAAWRHLPTSPESGLARWKGVLLHGLDHHNALWDHDLDPAILLLGWVHGALGATPDAARHRLRLRPHLPRIPASWAVSELRVADARVGASFERDGDSVVVRVDQTAGAFPLTLILELVVPDREIGAVTIDGRPATLDLREGIGGTIVPVQLVLDDRREIVIDVDGASDKKAAPDERGRR